MQKKGQVSIKVANHDRQSPQNEWVINIIKDHVTDLAHACMQKHVYFRI